MWTVVGSDGSPYSVKVRAALRYKGVRHRWVPIAWLGPDVWQERFPQLRAKVIPVLVRPDGSYANDSTPLLREIQERFPERPIVPLAAPMRFLAALLEDFADEWMTKVMFEGRFHTERDARFGAAWQIRQNVQATRNRELSGALIEQFAQRQRRRRELVGSSDWGVMEASLRAVCAALEASLDAGQPFLFGAHPTVADFALFGQLRQLATDPLPSTIMHDYPGAWAWVFRVDDLSGLDSDAAAAECQLTPAAEALLRLAAGTYLPFLVANAAALDAGADLVIVPVRVSGTQATHKQPPFKYQLRCLRELQSEYAALTSAEKAEVSAVLPSAAAVFAAPANRSAL